MKIKRGDLELGDIKDSIVPELLNSGFFLPSDMFWDETNKLWRPILELEVDSNRIKYKKVVEKVLKFMKIIKDLGLKEKAKQFLSRMQPQMECAQDKFFEAKNKLIEDYLPQIIEIIKQQVLPTIKTSIEVVLENETAYKKVITKTYKFLPPVITSVISYHLFETILLKQRSYILAKLKEKN